MGKSILEESVGSILIQRGSPTHLARISLWLINLMNINQLLSYLMKSLFIKTVVFCVAGYLGGVICRF